MTRAEALARAAQCERLALAATDPERQLVLRRIQHLWLRIAEHADKFAHVDLAFEQVMSFGAEAEDTHRLH